MSVLTLLFIAIVLVILADLILGSFTEKSLAANSVFFSKRSFSTSLGSILTALLRLSLFAVIVSVYLFGGLKIEPSQLVLLFGILAMILFLMHRG